MRGGPETYNSVGGDSETHDTDTVGGGLETHDKVGGGPKDYNAVGRYTRTTPLQCGETC